MKKILFSLSFMVLLLQFSSSAQASHGKYVIQDTPVTFFEKNVQTIEQRQTVEEKQEVQKTKEVIQEKPVVEQKETVTEDTETLTKEQETSDVKEAKSSTSDKVTEELKRETISNKKEKEVTKEKQNLKKNGNVSSSTINENFAKIFDENLDKAGLILDNADLIAAKGLLLMLKAVSQDEIEYQSAENTIVNAEKALNENGKLENLFGIKDSLLLLTDEKIKTIDFSTLSQEQKYMWGQGSYVLQVAQNRYKNVSNDLSTFYKPIADGKISAKNVKKQLSKAEKITGRIKDNVFLQEVALAIATRINSENQINISIAEKEQVRTNPNGITYIIENRTEEVDTLFGATMSDFAQKVGNKEVLSNNKNTNSNDKESKYFDLVAQGLDNISNNVENNNLVLSTDETFYLNKITEVLTSISEEYSEINNAVQDTIKTINKNKALKNVAIIDVEKLQDIQNQIKDKNKLIDVILTKINNINATKD